MAVRTAKAGTWTAGAILAAADLNKLPGGWIGYAESSSSQAGITTVTDMTGLSVTVAVGTSRRLQITGNTRVTQSTTTAANECHIYEGASSVNRSTITMVANETGMHTPMAVRTPSSGSNTYKLALEVAAGSVQSNLSAAQPAFILVEDIGPSS